MISLLWLFRCAFFISIRLLRCCKAFKKTALALLMDHLAGPDCLSPARYFATGQEQSALAKPECYLFKTQSGPAHRRAVVLSIGTRIAFVF
jgi:hypothetical protein